MLLRSGRALSVILGLVLGIACASDSATSGGAQGGPARVSVVTAPSANVTAGAAAGLFAVRVTDAAGNVLPNILVMFAATGGATLSPASARTDASGLASTQVSAGTVAGAASVLATVSGVATGASSLLTITPGSATTLVVAPKAMRFTAVGDTARLSAAVQDQFGNAGGSAAVTYAVLDPTLLSVDATGLVRVLRLNGSTLIIITANGKSDTTVVTVLSAGASVCTGVATPLGLAVGEVRLLSGNQYQCFSGGGTGAEYALVTFNSSTDQYNSLGLSILGDGLASPPTASLIAPTASLAAPSVARDEVAPAPSKLDESFHLRLLAEASREFKGQLGQARMVASRGVSYSNGTETRASASLIPSSAKVGDVVSVNVSANTCKGPLYHPARVTAIGSKSIILADTLNPAGGFSGTDYARIAANFDTLVYSLVVGAFGAPSDMDNNGRVAILFTRSVNELVDSTSGYYVGGFFNPRDLFPRKGQTAAEDCPGSNEAEMFYMLVPAPAPGIKGVTHTAGFVDSLTMGVVAHEFQHLINAGRRMYVNTGATEFEEPWLNEGLSHIAEELLYYRESQFAPRQNLDDATIRVNNQSRYVYWKNDASSNFGRFLTYLRTPESNSPFAANDELPTRGAAWSFLRYTADRIAPADGTLWQRFANATTTGLATVQGVLGQDPMPLFRDWSISNYTDDLGGVTDARYQQASWNFRNIFTRTYLNIPSYPLKTSALTDRTKSTVLVRSGSAAYVRFSAPAAREALLTLTSGGGAPSTPFQLAVIRTK